MASTLGNSALWLSFLFSVLQFIVSTRNNNTIIIFNTIIKNEKNKIIALRTHQDIGFLSTVISECYIQ